MSPVYTKSVSPLTSVSTLSIESPRSVKYWFMDFPSLKPRLLYPSNFVSGQSLTGFIEINTVSGWLRQIPSNALYTKKSETSSPPSWIYLNDPSGLITIFPLLGGVSITDVIGSPLTSVSLSNIPGEDTKIESFSFTV